MADRIAQTVVKQALEPELEKLFHPDSYGYRPGKSAHQAIGQARQRCWRYDWVIDLDIQAFFDSMDRKHLAAFLDHRVRDGVIRRALGKWMQAGVMEDGVSAIPSGAARKGV